MFLSIILSCLRIGKFKYECLSLTVFMHVCFAESSSHGLPVTTIPLWFARPLILLCCALASWEYTSQFNIQKLLTLQEICAPAGL